MIALELTMGVRFADQTVEIVHVEIAPNEALSHASAFWTLCLSLSGSCAVEGGSTGQTIQANELVLLPAGVEVQLRPIAPGGFNFQSMQFAIESIEGGLSLGARLALRQTVANIRSVQIIKPESALRTQFSSFVSLAFGKGRISLRDPLYFQAASLLLSQLRDHFNQYVTSAGETPDRIIRVLQSVEDASLQDLSVAEMARRCGCSRRHLSRVVREHFGSALVSVRTELRLDKAANLLRTPERKIIDVAMDCGFSHLGLFTAKFRERFGMTPGKWRRQLSQGSYNAEPPAPRRRSSTNPDRV